MLVGDFWAEVLIYEVTDRPNGPEDLVPSS